MEARRKGRGTRGDPVGFARENLVVITRATGYLGYYPDLTPEF